MKNGSGQTNHPKASKLSKEFQESHWKTLEVKIGNPKTLFFFLGSKIMAGSTLTEIERLAMFTAAERLILKCEEEPSFKKKFWWILWISRSLIQSLGSPLTQESLDSFRKTIREYQNYRRKFFDPCIYFGLLGELEKEIRIRIRTRFPVQTKEKSRIAVGYRDHGTARNPSEGSPSWQEVSMANIDKEEYKEGRRRVNLFQQIHVHQCQLYTNSVFTKTEKKESKSEIQRTTVPGKLN